MLVRPVCNIIILILSIQPLLADGYRRLHGVDGGEVVAEVLAVKEGVVTLRRQDGQVFKTPIDQFAEKDRQYLLGLDPRFRRSLDSAKARFNSFHGSHAPAQAQQVANLETDELWEFYLKAIPVLEKAASEGNAPAQYNLGVAHFEGLGVRQTIAKQLVGFR